MKIIKPSIDLDTWVFETKCPTCKSDIGIEAIDLRYKWNTSGCYYYVCELCNTRHLMKDVDVPPIVEADVKKHRSDPIVYSED